MPTTNDTTSGLASRCSRKFPQIPGEYRPAPPSKSARQAVRTTVYSQTGIRLGKVGLIALAAAIAAFPATAAEPATLPPTSSAENGTNVTVYPAAFFAEFQPQTAFDMVGHIPGFTFDGGDNSRGYSDTAGNVLIDGERPPSVSDSLASVLRRMPARSVERIVWRRMSLIVRSAAPCWRSVFCLIVHS